MKPSGSKWQKQQQIIYTPRDMRVLYALWGIKYMTTTQIAALFWQASSSDPLLALKSCQRRLRQLEKQGLIRRIRQAAKRGEGSKPDLFKLAAKSVPLLEYECGVDPKTVDTETWSDEELNPQIKHILATTDVQTAIRKACQSEGYSLEEWIDESALRSAATKDTVILTAANGETRQVAIIPDVFFILSRDGKRAFYRLEVDRATIELEASREQKRSIAQKMRRYLLLEESDSYRERYGTRPLRVLWAVKGKRRMHNMLKVTSRVIKQFVALPDEAPADEQQKQAYVQKQMEFTRLARRFLFTTLAQIQSQNVLTDPIWEVVGGKAPQSLLE